MTLMPPPQYDVPPKIPVIERLLSFRSFAVIPPIAAVAAGYCHGRKATAGRAILI